MFEKPIDSQRFVPKFNAGRLNPDKPFLSFKILEIKPEKIQDTSANAGIQELPQSNTRVEKNNTAIEMLERENLYTLFQSADIKAITAFLGDKKVESLAFHKEILRVQAENAESLSTANFLTYKDWKVLTAMEMFDKKTFEHSIGTYHVLRKKIERVPEFALEIMNEGITLEQLFRGALLHDFGKIGIPKFILNNEDNDSDWVKFFMKMDPAEQNKILTKNKIEIHQSIRGNEDKMIDFFSKNRIRASKFVPMKMSLDQQQIDFLIQHGFDPEQPLAKIVGIHEQYSEEMLGSLGYTIEAKLAGNHHNHPREQTNEKATSNTTLNISLEISSNAIHLADIHHAMGNDRSYHHKHPMLRILAFIVDSAEKQIADPNIDVRFNPIDTAKWIYDDLKVMNPSYLREIRNMVAKHQHHDYLQNRNLELGAIDDFLSDHLPEKQFQEYQNSII